MGNDFFPYEISRPDFTTAERIAQSDTTGKLFLSDPRGGVRPFDGAWLLSDGRIVEQYAGSYQRWFAYPSLEQYKSFVQPMPKYFKRYG